MSDPRLLGIGLATGLLWIVGCGQGADACRDVDCAGHGRCLVVDSAPVCACDPGYRAAGPTCSVDACASFPCVHGTCRQADGQLRCDCAPGYAAELCDTCAEGFSPQGLTCQPDSVCAEPVCVHGVCREQDGLPVCDCQTGYAGQWCDACAPGWMPDGLICVLAQADQCQPNPCLQENRTVCVPEGQSFSCDCDPGYHLEGEQCLPDQVDACLPNPCVEPNRTRCLTEGPGFRCECDPGYQDNDQNGSCLPGCALAGLNCPPGEICSDVTGEARCVVGSQPAIHISFHWHMHQPIYWPYESIVETEANGRMGYSLYEIHHTRAGPYGSWPRDAVDAGRHLPHLGAQVSFSGSLMENLNQMTAAGAWGQGWQAPWIEANGWDTARGNPRLDLVRFGLHHPLMGLIDPADIQLQLAAHRVATARNFGTVRSRGLFPPECAFSVRMIPALVAEGIEWVLVDNIHFDRAHVDYPWVPQSNLPPPNPADQQNTAPTAWVQLNDLWAPSRVAAPWGYRPHWVQYTDPVNGQVQRIIAVPAARYEGNEDGRGGFGALQYEAVFSQYEQYNTDPAHPMLVVLHHDGDNYGGGTDSYYHSNFSAFVAWIQAQPDRFQATTIQDYLDAYPPDPADVIHIEDGSWSGADNGDPEFMKWNGDPDAGGYSPDRNSWAVITAVKNRVLAAEAIQPHSSAAAVVDGIGNATDQAWHFLLNAETSCYWYWDFSQGGIWDSHPTRAANQAAVFADQVLASGPDSVGPTIYLPQREPYNPGLAGEPTDVTVWTFVYDVSGLASVQLHWRVDPDGLRDAANDLYSGGNWQQAPMLETGPAPQTDPVPLYQASGFAAVIEGVTLALVDYYVSATDTQGKLNRSPLMHMWIAGGGR